MNRRTSAVVAFVGVVVAVSGLVPGAIVAEHGADSTDFTVSTDDPAPNASEVSYVLDVELTDNFGDSRSGIDNVTEATFTLESGDVSGCSGTPVLGDSATLSIVTADGQESEFEEYEGSFSGGTADFDVSSTSNDYVVNSILRLELDGCVDNPSTAGWYQADVVVSGEAFGSDEQVTLEATSHYFPICENCDNESAARDELGPPPSEPTPTPTATPTATPEPTPTPTEEPEPTPTQPDDDDPGSTPTPTDEPDGGDDGDGGADEQVFGMDPLVVVGIVGAVSVGIAVFGATRL